MDPIQDNLIPYQNWKSKSRNYYPKRVTLTIPYEEYTPTVNNNKEVDSANIVTIQKKARVRGTRGWEAHSLLLKDSFSDNLFSQEDFHLSHNSFRQNYESLKKKARLVGEVPYEFKSFLFTLESDINRIDKTSIQVPT